MLLQSTRLETSLGDDLLAAVVAFEADILVAFDDVDETIVVVL